MVSAGTPSGNSGCRGIHPGSGAVAGQFHNPAVQVGTGCFSLGHFHVFPSQSGLCSATTTSQDSQTTLGSNLGCSTEAAQTWTVWELPLQVMAKWDVSVIPGHLQCSSGSCHLLNCWNSQALSSPLHGIPGLLCFPPLPSLPCPPHSHTTSHGPSLSFIYSRPRPVPSSRVSAALCRIIPRFFLSLGFPGLLIVIHGLYPAIPSSLPGDFYPSSLFLHFHTVPPKLSISWA